MTAQELEFRHTWTKLRVAWQAYQEGSPDEVSFPVVTGQLVEALRKLSQMGYTVTGDCPCGQPHAHKAHRVHYESGPRCLSVTPDELRSRIWWRLRDMQKEQEQMGHKVRASYYGKGLAWLTVVWKVHKIDSKMRTITFTEETI